MLLKNEPRVHHEYWWVCSACFNTEELTTSTVVCGSMLKVFDFALRMFVLGQTGKLKWIAAFTKSKEAYKNPKTFRHALAFYWTAFVKPYLRLPGVVEIDETLASAKCFTALLSYPMHRWVFGMYCRQTKIPIIYHVKSRGFWNIHPLIKQHVEPGSIVISDEMQTYVNFQSSKSVLAKFGFYHFWIVHSNRYSHEKFPFVYTSSIESLWGHLKNQNQNMKSEMKPKAIQSFCDAFSCRHIIKKDKLYRFMLKCIRTFFNH